MSKTLDIILKTFEKNIQHRKEKHLETEYWRHNTVTKEHDHRIRG